MAFILIFLLHNAQPLPGGSNPQMTGHSLRVCVKVLTKAVAINQIILVIKAQSKGRDLRYGMVVAQSLTHTGYTDCSESLKDLRVSVPQAIRKGETAVLMCDFDLEGDSLYSVKWYKGRREFYRFTPKDEFPIKTFPIGKVNVDKSKSNMTQLTLLGVDPSLSGVYNCEVSAESPSFHTELKSGEMNVVEIPSLTPVLTGLKSKYGVGETLEGTCISGGSRPAANLTWFLNGEKVHRDHMFVTTTTVKDSRQLLVSKSRLKFIVKTHSFKSGKLNLRCSANIHNVYNQAIELDIEEDKPKLNSEATQVVVLPSNFLEKKGDTNARNRNNKGFAFSRDVHHDCRRQLVVELLISAILLLLTR